MSGRVRVSYSIDEAHARMCGKVRIVIGTGREFVFIYFQISLALRE